MRNPLCCWMNHELCLQRLNMSDGCTASLRPEVPPPHPPFLSAHTSEEPPFRSEPLTDPDALLQHWLFLKDAPGIQLVSNRMSSYPSLMQFLSSTSHMSQNQPTEPLTYFLKRFHHLWAVKVPSAFGDSHFSKLLYELTKKKREKKLHN